MHIDKEGSGKCGTEDQSVYFAGCRVGEGSSTAVW